MTLITVLISIVCMSVVVTSAYASLDETRSTVVSSGTIPDDYLIEPTGTYRDDRNPYVAYNAMQSWLDFKGEDQASDRFQNQVNRAMFNIVTLLDGNSNHHEVTALVVAKERVEGTYTDTGYLKKYHDYIIDEYDVPSDISSIDAGLNRTLGDMLSLADAIKSVTDKAASIGGIPLDLWSDDSEYWMDVELATYCNLDTGVFNSTCNYPIPIQEEITDETAGERSGEIGTRYSHGGWYYWRALGCVGWYGAVCSDIESFGFNRSYSGTFGNIVSGSAIASKLVVNHVPLGASGSITVNVYEGIYDSDTASTTLSSRGTIDLTQTTYAWIGGHPCIVLLPNILFYQHCVAINDWAFTGSISASVPSDPIIIPPSPPALSGSAGQDQSVMAGQTVTLTGSSNYNGASYEWVQQEDDDVMVDLQDASTSTPTFIAPSAAPNPGSTGDVILTFILDVTFGSSSVQDSVRVTVKNTTPDVTWEGPTLPLWKYVGILPIKEFQAKYDLTAIDADSLDLLTLSVSTLPLPSNAALAVCESLLDADEVAEIYRTPGTIIAADVLPDSTSSVCIVGLGTTDNGKFSVQITDGKAVSEPITIPFTMTSPVDAALTVGQFIGLYPSPPTAVISSIAFYWDYLLTSYFTIWKCNINHYGCEEPSVIYMGSLTNSNQPSSDTRDTHTITPNPDPLTPGWSFVANVTDTTTTTGPGIQVILNSTDTTTNQRSTESDTDGAEPSAIMTMHDADVEEGDTYKYMMRVFAGGMGSEFIPLGTITIPDTTAPELSLFGPSILVVPTGSSWLDPGYNATDNVDGNITDSVIITGTVDTATAGTYRITYDVYDAGGNTAQQVRTVHVSPDGVIYAHTGGDRIVTEGDTITLDGIGYKDGSTPLFYSWSQQPSTPTIPLGNVASPTFTAPLVDRPTTIILTLIVSDGTDTASHDMTLRILDVPDPTDYFVTTWQTTTPNESITIPVNDAPGNYTIDWGDGTIYEEVSGDQTHTYAAAGNHTVRIIYDFPGIHLGADRTNAAKLVSIDQWGNIQWGTMDSAFRYAVNMVHNAADVPDLTSVTSTKHMFAEVLSFNGDLSDWDVSSVRDMSFMFDYAPSFSSDLSRWDTSSATNMDSMFRSAFVFDSDISGWDVSSATNMDEMFFGADAFDSDISGWDVSSATTMTSILYDVASFRANLGAWYIIPDTTTVDSAPGTVGTISAQNSFLDGQNPVYGIGTGGDSTSFSMNGDNLIMDVIPDKQLYTVNVTSTGTFGTNNHRMLEISVTGSANQPPTVDAGADQTVDEGDTVHLGGVASDTDGDSLVYTWTHDSTLPVTLSDDTALATTFVAPQVNDTVAITFTLTVSDGINPDVTDQVIVTVTEVPAPVDPADNRVIGDVSVSSTVAGIIQVEWDAPTEIPVDYRLAWAVSDEPFLPHNNLQGNAYPTTSSYTITDLDEGESYKVKVRARYDDSPNGAWSSTEHVVVSSQTQHAPTSDAGPDQTVRAGQLVTLDGSGSSDMDENDTLTYSWTQTGGPNVALINPTSIHPTFTAPSSAATLSFSLMVFDSTLMFSDDAVIITVTANDTTPIEPEPDANRPPIVSAGSSLTLDEGTQITLNGTATDPDGDAMTYRWLQSPSEPVIVFGSPNSLTTTITVPHVDANTRIVLLLIADDGTHSVNDAIVLDITNVD